MLELFPDLEVTAYALKLARKRLKFPLSSLDDLEPLFDHGRASFKGRSFSSDQAREYLPPEFFPIESPRDLGTKIAIALQRAYLLHSQELVEQPPGAAHGPDGDVTRLPSPAPPRLSGFPPATAGGE